VSIAGTESSFILVAGGNSELVIGIIHVKPGEVLRILEAIEEL
jgi:hypothetical protein